MSTNNSSSELYGVDMPYSMEAEQAVLGAVLIEPSTINQVADMLQADDFYLPEHQVIYTVMMKKMMENKPIDFITVLESLKSEDVFQGDEGKAYLLKLTKEVPSVSNVLRYAKIVMEKHVLRKLATSSRKILNEAMDPGCDAPALLDAAEQAIYDIRREKNTGTLEQIDQTIASNFEKWGKMADPELRDQFIGIPTGLAELDEITTGLNRSDLIIIGARPGVGKTSIILNIARHVALVEKRTVAVFNLEMSKEQIVNRLISMEARVSGKKLRTGELSTNEWSRIGVASSAFMGAPIYIDDTSNITVTEMKARLRRIENLGVVFIDYLQLMSDPIAARENRTNEVATITRNLKIMAKELDVPVVVCCQLNRESVKTAGTLPALKDLRESGSIEQDADQVIMIHREEMNINQAADPSKVERGTATIMVVKNRHGEMGNVKMNFEGEFTQFSSRTPEQKEQDRAYESGV